MKQINVNGENDAAKEANRCGESTKLSPESPGVTSACGCSGKKPHTYRPAVDIVETEGEILLTADLPGATPEGIDVRYEKGTLSIYAPAIEGSTVRDNKTLRREFNTGAFARSFELGEIINPENITANYGNGVLTLHLPKAEVAKVHRIPVRH